jgi:aminomethyltransferase
MAEMLLRTPLTLAHEAAGARMVPFGGWLMPVSYTSILAEHQHTRGAAGLFDLSHMGRLRIEGSAALDLIQEAVTNDAGRLRPGGIQYALMCNDHGGIIDDVLVYRLADDWSLVVNASNRLRVLHHLQALAESHPGATIRDDTFETALLGIQGPQAEEVLQPLVSSELEGLGYYRARADQIRFSGTDAAHDVLISRTGYTGEDGFEITIAASDAVDLWSALCTDERVEPAGLGARDTLRLEAGMPLYGHELSDERTPYEAGLERFVKLDKGNFVGRDALVRLAERAPETRLIGLSFEPGVIPRQGNAVLLEGRSAGEVASGTFSPTLQRPIATAYVTPPAAEADRLSVSVRDRDITARVVSLPFVPHRTKTRRG